MTAPSLQSPVHQDGNLIEVPVRRVNFWLEPQTILLLDEALEEMSAAGPLDPVAYNCFAITGRKIRIDPVSEYMQSNGEADLCGRPPEILSAAEPRRSRLALGAVALGQDVGIFSLIKRVHDITRDNDNDHIRLIVFRGCAIAYAHRKPTAEEQAETGDLHIPVMRALLPPMKSRHAELVSSQMINRALEVIAPTLNISLGIEKPRFRLAWPDRLD